MITLTEERLDKAKTPNGGYNAKQLRILGVEYPPKKGWKKSLFGTQVPLAVFVRFVRFVKASGNYKYLNEIEALLPTLIPPTYLSELISTTPKKANNHTKAAAYDDPTKIDVSQYACYPKKKKTSANRKAQIKAIINFRIHNAARALVEEDSEYQGFAEHILKIQEPSVSPQDIDSLRLFLRRCRLRISMRNGRAEKIKKPPKPTPEEQEIMSRIGMENRLTKSMEKRMRVAKKFDRASKVGSYRYKDKFSATQSDTQQYLYVIRVVDNDKVKIGVSKNPAKRLSSLQTANADNLYISLVFDTNDLAVNEEARLHLYFKSRHLKGEWFQGINDDEITTALRDRARVI